MSYKKFILPMTGTVLDIRHNLPTQENKDFAKSKGWPEPREKFIVDFLTRSSDGINEVIPVESLTRPTLEIGKPGSLSVEISAPKIYFNLNLKNKA